MANKLQFKVSSSLKNIIGKDLITDDFIAIFELVKNSYDAHAKEVIIKIEKNRIIIEDDGKGMSLDDLKQKWLFVAYSAKKEGVEDEDIFSKPEYEDYRNKINSKRYYAGAKGIGRFSCDRLGKNLTLYTKKVNSNKTEKLEIQWEEFEEDAKKEFINIQVSHDTVNYPRLAKKNNGTILEITNLNSLWSRKKILELKRSLSKLINPFEALDKEKKQKEQLNIIFDVPAELKKDESLKEYHQKVNGSVKSFLFEKLNVKTTQIITKISKEFILSELIDRGTPIYKIKEKNLEYSHLQDVRIHLFYLNRAAKTNFTKTMGIQPVKFGSIFLFKNGFRIYPFGEEGDDSLKIDRRKQQGYARYLGTRDLLGRVELFGEGHKFNEQFKEASSRDSGLVETEGYQELVTVFFEKGLRRLERYVVDIQWVLKDSEDKDRTDTSLYGIESKKEIINLIHSLSNTKNIELVKYNKDFLYLINERIEDESEEVFDQLYDIAVKVDDKSFVNELLLAKKEFLKLKKEKKAAEEQARKAEEAKQKAEEAREEAEKKRQEEQAKRKEAELKAKAEENRRKEAELKEREAELKRKEAELKAQEETKKRQEAETELGLEKDKNTYLLATRKTLSPDAEGLIHNIKFSSNKIRSNVNILIDQIKNDIATKVELLRRLGVISIWSEKALKISELITRANFKTTSETQIIDIVKFTKQYFSLFNDIYDKNKLAFEVRESSASLERRIGILDLSLVFDNFIFNSEKAGASKMLVECKNTTKKTLVISISDDGKGVNEVFLTKPEIMFELGVTTTDGSGIGLAVVKESLKQLNAEVEFLGNKVILKGATFQITFK